MSAADPRLTAFDRLVGEWDTEATHPATGDHVVRGHASFEWLEGGWFLVQRATTDHPDFPDSVVVLGCSPDGAHHGDDDLSGDHDVAAHYFDSRGVRRVYVGDLRDGTWQLSRDEPGFDQRFTGTFTDDDQRIDGQWQMRTDDATWVDDLKITYRRVSART